MGALLAKFRKHKTTEEVLEKLDEEIHQIEKYSLNTQERKKRFVGNFLAISIGIYVIAFIVFYFVYFPPTWRERIIYSVPLFLFPLVIILLRTIFTWYFQRKLNKNSNKLTELRGEKKKILEQVMDKETYKVAVNLLTRFGDKTNGNKFSYGFTPRAANSTQIASTAVVPSQSQNQSVRSLSSATAAGKGNLTSNVRQLNTSLTATPRAISNLYQQPGSGASDIRAAPIGMPRQLALTPQTRINQGLRRRTPFPIVNQQEKGVFERIVDVLIGDGPQDRFAMICKECFAHNGMALKEEFDYTTFRCAFCNALNPARKERPVAPRLPIQLSVMGSPRAGITPKEDSDSSDSDNESDDETEGDYRLNKVLQLQVSEVVSEPSESNASAFEEVPVATDDTETVANEDCIESMTVGVDSNEKLTKDPHIQEQSDSESTDAKPIDAHVINATLNSNDEFKKEM